MNYELLKAFLAEKGMKQRFVAQGIGVSDKRMHDLLNGGRWKLPEVIAVCKLLNLTKRQRDEIFFADMLSDRSTTKGGTV